MIAHREFVQYSPEFWEARRGKPSASEFGRILTPNGAETKFTCVAEDGETCGTKHGKRDVAEKCAKKRKGFTVIECAIELASGHNSYINQLIADSIFFDPNFQTERPTNDAMREGTRREPDSRNWYAMHYNVDVEQVGGIETDDGRLWSSPDGLVRCAAGKLGALELKNPTLEKHIEWLRGGVLPEEHQTQCHGHIVVGSSELEFCDFVSYHPAAPVQFSIRVYPDGFTIKLTAALKEFCVRYAEAKAKVLQML